MAPTSHVNTLFPQGPLMITHRGWRKGGEDQDVSISFFGTDTQPRSAPVTVPERQKPRNQFQFVSTTKPGTSKDRNARQLVRSHVMKEVGRKKRQEKKKLRSRPVFKVESPLVPPKAFENDTETKTSAHADEFHSDDLKSAEIPYPFGNPTALCTSLYPIEMSEDTHILLGKCLAHATKRSYPLERRLKFSFLQPSEWFQFAVTDPAMLHAFLYSGAVSLALMQGKTESKESIYHQNRTVSIIQKRLCDSYIDDSTIGAVTCLALGESISGNLDLWRLHMKGLRHMVQTRGNLSSFNSLLQGKLHRSDLLGALDYASTPHLDLKRGSKSSTWSILPTSMLDYTERVMSRLLRDCQIDVDLVKPMTELSHLSQTIQYTRMMPGTVCDPNLFCEDMYWIAYQLLSLPKISIDLTAELPISRACRLGGLLYIRGILHEYPHSGPGSSVLLDQLRTSLGEVYATRAMVPLLAWLLLLGGMQSKGGQRSWFIEKLAQLMAGCHMSSPQDILMGMDGLLSFREIFGTVVDTIWEAALALQTTEEWFDVEVADISNANMR